MSDNHRHHHHRRRHTSGHSDEHIGILHHGMVHKPEVAELQTLCNKINESAGKRCIVKADGNFWVDTIDSIQSAQQVAIKSGYLKKHKANGIYDEATAKAFAELEKDLFHDKDDKSAPRRPISIAATTTVAGPHGDIDQHLASQQLRSVLKANDFIAPLDGTHSIRSGFGPRKAPVAGASRNHPGLDIAAPIGTPVYATADGTVESAARAGGYGNRIVLEHDNQDPKHSIETLYGHLSRFVKGLKAGDSVHKGDLIGYVGSTGISTGPHLHYEVRIDGDAVNPHIRGKTYSRGDDLTAPVVAAVVEVKKTTVAVPVRLPTQNAGANGTLPPAPAPTVFTKTMDVLNSSLPWNR